MKVEVPPGIRPEGWLEWCAHLLGGAVYRDHLQCPALLPMPQKGQLGFWSFCILLFSVSHNCTYTRLFIMSCILLQETFVQVQALQQRVPDPRCQPISKPSSYGYWVCLSTQKFKTLLNVMHLYNSTSFPFIIMKTDFPLKLLKLTIAIWKLTQIMNLLNRVQSLQIPAGYTHLACYIKNREEEADIGNVDLFHLLLIVIIQHLC